MQSKIIRTGILCACLLLPVFPGGGQCLARDCAALHDAIRQEHSLLKRRQLFEEAVQQCPGNVALHYDYGFTLERLRHYREALEQYRLVADIAPEMARAYFSMGDVYQVLEEVDEAISMYQKGLELEPENTRGRKRLEELLQMQAGN